MEPIKFGKAICYSGYRFGQSPKTVIPSREEILEDLEILVKEGFQYIRMYDPNLHAKTVLELIREKSLPLKCMIGIDSDPEVNNPECPFEVQNFSKEELEQNRLRNDGELEKLIQLAKDYDEEIIAVSIGNENTPSWGAHMVPVDRLIHHAKRLHQELNKPVTFCEGVFEWPALMELAEYMDIISVHSYPYHYGNTIEEAVKVNKKHYDEMKKTFPDKQVIFTEMGWTTNDDNTVLPKRATVANQIAYLTELEKWIEEENVIVFLFEAFDEPWKASSVEKSECNWGIYDVNRKRKWEKQ